MSNYDDTDNDQQLAELADELLEQVAKGKFKDMWESNNDFEFAQLEGSYDEWYK